MAGKLAKPLPNPAMPLKEVRHERLAQLRAEGVPVTQAAKDVGISRQQTSVLLNGETPTALALQARIAHLRASSTVVIPNSTKLLHEMHQQAMMAIANGGYKAGLDALKFLYQERKEAEKAGIVAAGVPVADEDDEAAIDALTDDWGDVDVEG